MALQILRRLYGSAFSIDPPIFGQMVSSAIPTILASCALSGDRLPGQTIEPSRRCPR
jgi:hypothetical protein